MNIYAIYVNPEQENDAIIPIKEEFSFIAAIFSFFWVLYYKMWTILTIIVAAHLLIALLQNNSTQAALGSVVEIFFIFIFGFFASDLREYDLQKKGYKLKDIILAPSVEEAEIKFLMREGVVSLSHQ